MTATGGPSASQRTPRSGGGPSLCARPSMERPPGTRPPRSARRSSNTPSRSMKKASFCWTRSWPRSYRPAQGSLVAVVGPSTTERIQTLQRVVSARRTRLSLKSPAAATLDAEVWWDEGGRLLRLRLPFEDLDAVREDIGSVAARRVGVTRANDEVVRIAANGFWLTGTLSKPMSASGPQPAVLLVAGPAVVDRDETTGGVPVFGHLASQLADLGFVVLRYDKRGTGQSGGRPESATLRDYADDVRAAVRTIGDRKDVDRKRVALLGYGDGGWVAMLAADKRVAALVLVGTGGVSGTELNIYQVVHGLDRSDKTADERLLIADLQRRIQTAVLTGKGWDGPDMSAAIRRQADTPYFQSYLAFDPAKAMRDIAQPILILQGALDAEVPPANADQLEAAAKGRKRPGVVEASTGETDESQNLGQLEVSPDVGNSVASWLTKTVPARP
ncbi:MAG: hypothetical protein DMF90_15100 [Acidobacteria bacterium]|nr:MAG: hypothetical protein DMF90_15100 [Acidobacteriota bacterium]